MDKHEVVIDKNLTGYYLGVCDGRLIYDLDIEIASLINMDEKFYKNSLVLAFSGFRDYDEIYFKYKSDCKAAAQWLQNKLNEGGDHMNKQGLVLKENEKKKLTFGDLEPGELFTSGNGIIKRKLTENGLLSETGYVGRGFFVLESGKDIGNIYLMNKSDSVRRVKLVNNECVYV